MLKRMMDIFLSLIMLVIFSPLMLFVALIIKIKIGSPVFFKQERPGYVGKPFTLMKFRTMTMEKDQDGQLLDDNGRATKVGNLIRSLSMDELPQLLNVIKGDISLIGPRPLLMEYLPLYSKEQSRRHEVRPGITGWAQVNGRNGITWEEKFNYDLYYVDNQSFLFDLKIIFMTIKTVFIKEGIQDKGHFSKEPFKGNTKYDSLKTNFK
ncbi:sugar transferase [Salipaludibacillus sp. HK11]|uniref:sugar transferase n=1 Tax=Salipaludibacillus sp. HK11 TaxID=3394320 RepID=UPI0039FC2F7C